MKAKREPNYWKIAAGEKGYLWPEQRDAKVIAIGWSEMGNLKRYRNNYKKFSGDFKRKFRGDSPKQLWNFYKDVKKGDKVIACAGDKIFGIGQITDEYAFRKDLEYSHSKPVRYDFVFWEPFKIEQLKLPTKIENLFKYRCFKKTLLNLDVKAYQWNSQDVFNKIELAIKKSQMG